MTDDIVERLRRGSVAIYIAVEKCAADDISVMMNQAADEIERLRNECDELEQNAIAAGRFYQNAKVEIEQFRAPECERLRTAVHELMGALRELWDEKTYSAEAFDNDPSVKIARRALESKP